MANNTYRFISGIGESLAGKSKNYFDKVLHMVDPAKQGKLEKALELGTRGLAKHRMVANRGLGIIDDLASAHVAPSSLAGAGVGSVGGFLMAPGSEHENMMGKTTYKGPGLVGRLQGALTGGLIGGGVGAGYGLNKLNTLAKTIAHGKDLPPGVVTQFLEGLGDRERRAIVNKAVGQVDPKLLNKASLKNGPVIDVKAFMNPVNIANRKVETTNAVNNLRNQVLQIEQSSHKHTPEGLLKRHVLEQLFGTKDLNSLSPQVMEAKVTALASDPKLYNNAKALLAPNVLNRASSNYANAIAEGKAEAAANATADWAGMGLITGGLVNPFTGGLPLGTVAGGGIGAAFGRGVQMFKNRFGRLPTEAEVRILEAMAEKSSRIPVKMPKGNRVVDSSLNDILGNLGAAPVTSNLFQQAGKYRTNYSNMRMTPSEAAALQAKYVGLPLLTSGGLLAAMYAARAPQASTTQEGK